MFLVNNLTSIFRTVLATLYSNINYITNGEENKLPSGSLKYIIPFLPLHFNPKNNSQQFFLENDNKTLPKEKNWNSQTFGLKLFMSKGENLT